MNCDQFQDALAAQASGPIDGEFEGHRRECSECRDYARSMQQLLDGFANSRAAPAPQDALRSRRAAQRNPETRKPKPWAAIAALCLAAVGFALWLNRSPSAPIRPAGSGETASATLFEIPDEEFLLEVVELESDDEDSDYVYFDVIELSGANSAEYFFVERSK